jgi:hypothetical protein
MLNKYCYDKYSNTNNNTKGISPVGGNPFFGNPVCAVTVLPLDEKKTNKNSFLLFALR